MWTELDCMQCAHGLSAYSVLQHVVRQCSAASVAAVSSAHMLSVARVSSLSPLCSPWKASQHPLEKFPASCPIKDSGLPASKPCHKPGTHARAFRWWGQVSSLFWA